MARLNKKYLLKRCAWQRPYVLPVGSMPGPIWCLGAVDGDFAIFFIGEDLRRYLSLGDQVRIVSLETFIGLANQGKL